MDPNFVCENCGHAQLNKDYDDTDSTETSHNPHKIPALLIFIALCLAGLLVAIVGYFFTQFLLFLVNIIGNNI